MSGSMKADDKKTYGVHEIGVWRLVALPGHPEWDELEPKATKDPRKSGGCQEGVTHK